MNVIEHCYIFQVYLAEIAPPQLRGLLGSSNQLGIVTGVFLSYLIGLFNLIFRCLLKKSWFIFLN